VNAALYVLSNGGVSIHIHSTQLSGVGTVVHIAKKIITGTENLCGTIAMTSLSRNKNRHISKIQDERISSNPLHVTITQDVHFTRRAKSSQTLLYTSLNRHPTRHSQLHKLWHQWSWTKKWQRIILRVVGAWHVRRYRLQ
jgi:hypothetical protein